MPPLALLILLAPPTAPPPYSSPQPTRPSANRIVLRPILDDLASLTLRNLPALPVARGQLPVVRLKDHDGFKCWALAWTRKF